jgi:hypothetical protein
VPVEAEINLEFLAGELSKARKDIKSMKTPQPLLRDFATSLPITANPQCIVLNNMYPAVGRIWEITQVGVFGPDGHTAVTNAIADIYAGPTSGTDFPGDFACFIDSGTVPCNFLIGDHKCYANAGDRIYAWIYGYTAGAYLTLAGTVRDWRVEDRSETSI